MSDLFLSEDAKKLLERKFILILGDSIQRSLYKDLVSLLNDSAYVKDDELKTKGELKFQGDSLLDGGIHNLTNGTGYREVRKFMTDRHIVQFVFVTRCYNSYISNTLDLLQKTTTPDVIIMNSCLWDLTRYGDNGVEKYKSNLRKLFSTIDTLFPRSTLFIWISTLPISRTAYGGFLVPEVEHLKNTLRLEILEANKFAYELLKEFSFDMLDIHFYLRHHIHRRVKDGVHWDMTAHRRITNLLLTHISEAWQQKLPGRIQKFDSPSNSGTI